MIENVVRTLGGVSAFGIISICIFFAFFTGMLLWAGFLKPTYLKSMSGLPLECDSDSNDQSQTKLDSSHE
jgi:hypothetical protein